MKLFTLTFLCFIGLTCNAQTQKELIGKWKLVQQTKDGVVTTPKDTYQMFMENGKFQGINGDKSREGKWKLSDDNTKLTIMISIISVNFDIVYFDANKRTINSPQTGKLEYEKVLE
ncbi:lipocalin-like domain-containing protein [Flavobacterium aestivum]|uniref:lipocalin-like domain-containing protein n=1 Tax=Flavobacterium aestivum TaxID=3003257 RepID=UPI002286C837|nr:glycoside hydrolase family 43 C-terminal domain-containing protein [Flavobacterium aestivum]